MALAPALKLQTSSRHLYSCRNPGKEAALNHPAVVRSRFSDIATNLSCIREGHFCSARFHKSYPQKVTATLLGAQCSPINNGEGRLNQSGVVVPSFYRYTKPCRPVERCRCSDRGHASAEAEAKKETPTSKSFDEVLRDVVEDDISLELSLEDIVKDVVASRLEEANAAPPESGQTTSRSASLDGSAEETSHRQVTGGEGEKGLKIEVAPKVLEALDSTGELGSKSLFDLVEEKRKRKLAEKAKAAAEADSPFKPLKDAFAKLSLSRKQSGAEGKGKVGTSVRKDVSYTMDMDFVEPPPLQQSLELFEEALEDGEFEEFNGWVQDVTQGVNKATGVKVSLDLDSKPSVSEQFTMAFKGLVETSQYLVGVNGRPVRTLPTKIAEQLLDLWVLPGQRKVTGSDLEKMGIASSAKTVESAQLQREMFRSGPFYAQWFERWRNGWVVTGYLEGEPADVRARLQARLDQHFPEHNLVLFLLNTPQEVPWCLIIPANEPIQFAFPPTLRQSVFASAVVSAFVMWICKGIAIADPLLLNGEEAAIALAALPLGLLAILFAGSIARSAVASFYGVRDRFPIPLPMPGLGAIGMTTEISGVMPNRAALIDIPLAGSLATAAASVAMITSSHSWLAWRFPQSGPLILVPPGTLHHSYVLSYLVSQLQKAAVVGPDDVVYMAIHPLAFAGLLGLNATALSLLPLSRTDGGRIAQGLVGRAGHVLATAATCALLLVGFIFGDTSLSLGLYLYNADTHSEWYQKDEVTEVGFPRTLVAFLTMALGVTVLSPTFGWIPFHSLVKTANSVPTLLPTWGNM